GRRGGAERAVRRWLVALSAVAVLAAADPAALSDQAMELARQKRFAEAQQLWKQALAIDGGHFPALFNLGWMHFQQSDFAAAEGYLEKAAATESADFNTHYALGLARSKLGRREDALRAWRRALELQPRQVKLMQVMSVEYGAGRYHQEAAAVAERAIGVNPADESLYLMAITAHRQAGELSKGGEVARRAAEQFPDS